MHVDFKNSTTVMPRIPRSSSNRAPGSCVISAPELKGAPRLFARFAVATQFGGSLDCWL